MTGYGYGMTPGLVSPESRINTPLQSGVWTWAVCACAASCEEVGWPYFDVVGWRVMLGEVVTMVGLAAAPSNSKLPLFHSILNPIEAHAFCMEEAIASQSSLCTTSL
jgi:hypothetical protein